MADAIEAASSFIGGRRREELDSDRMHAYFDVDLDILWNTVTQALPPLRGQIQPALGTAK